MLHVRYFGDQEKHELPTQSVHILLRNGGPTKGDDGNAKTMTSPRYKSDTRFKQTYLHQALNGLQKRKLCVCNVRKKIF